MSREALLEPQQFTAGAVPVRATEAAAKPAFPGPRQMDLPFRVHAGYAGALLAFLLLVSSVAISSGPMPVVLAICLFFYAMYFGVMNLMAHVHTGEPQQRDTYTSDGIMTASGHLTARQASAQVLTLPFLVAAFGLFAAIAGRLIF